MIAKYNLMEYIDRNFSNGLFYLSGSNYVPAYKPTMRGNRFITSEIEPELESAISRYRIEQKDVYFISPFPVYLPFLMFYGKIQGKSDCLFDILFNSGENVHYYSAFIYRVR